MLVGTRGQKLSTWALGHLKLKTLENEKKKKKCLLVYGGYCSNSDLPSMLKMRETSRGWRERKI